MMEDKHNHNINILTQEHEGNIQMLAQRDSHIQKLSKINTEL
jgi:hypothetical protein